MEHTEKAPPLTHGEIEFDQTNRNLETLNGLFKGNLGRELNRLDVRGTPYSVLDAPSGSQAQAAIEVALAHPLARVTAVDLSLNQSRTTFDIITNLTCSNGDLFDLPVEPNSIDLAYCYGYFRYLEERGEFDKLLKVMGNFSKILKPGGKALLDLNPSIFRKIPGFDQKVFEKEHQITLNSAFRGYPLSVIVERLWLDGKLTDPRYVVVTKQKLTTQ